MASMKCLALRGALAVTFFALIVAADCSPQSIATGAPAQNPPKKPPGEEEEDVAKPKPKVPLRVDDDESDTKRPKRSKNTIPRLAELAAEAENVKFSVIKDIYLQLSVPHDLVRWHQGLGKLQKIEPFPRRIDKETATPPMRFQFYGDNWKRGPAETYTRVDVMFIDPFERIALLQVRRLLDPNGYSRTLPRMDVLQAAERVLAAVVSFHESALEQGLRQGDWGELSQALRKELLYAQLEMLSILAKEGNWEQAYDMAVRLSEVYAKAGEQQKLIAAQLEPFLQQAIKKEDYATARLRMRLLEELFPRIAVSGDATTKLARAAAELLDRARSEKDKEKKIKLLDTAETIWPRLEGLRNYRLEVTEAYPILNVGVPSLPMFMSPEMAASDSEKQVVEMLFEGLIKSVNDPGRGNRYVPCLAAERPRLIPLGREFVIARDAFWSDGAPVTTGDVRHTLQIMHEHGEADLIEDARFGKDPFHVWLTMRQGFLDPLALMTFKIMPSVAPVERSLAEAFARRPVGSGPFLWEKSTNQRVTFIANHNYRRAGKLGMPFIQSIRFVRTEDPAADFTKQARDERLDVLIDFPTAQLKNVRSVARVFTLPNRRIYFLAVNHRNASLQSAKVRRALAHAIDRVQILNDVFRGDDKNDKQPPHRPLNGPYPPGCWACKGDLKPDLFNSALARVLADESKEALRAPRLMLKYPDNDKLIEKACEMIRDQVKNNSGIDLRLEPRTPAQLRQEVETSQDFELAYYYYDYPNNAYWLWPLFNPNQRKPGGRNFLGYTPAAELQTLFRKAIDHREFARVREYTHLIHEMLQKEEMPFIPLWQLDSHFAIHKDVQTYPRSPDQLDPLRLFTDIEQWRVASGR